MQLEVKKYLYDIQISINSIFEYLGEKRDFNEYLSNKLLRRGIERELEIIGEAANRILKIDSEINIENARKIVDLRNWVIHGYDKIDDVIIWGIISKHLPILKTQVDELLK
jgi:uncharacterized protein with HEPN domain